jgi:hypothetical protein
MIKGAGRAEVVIGDDLEDVWGTQLAYSTEPVEGKMVTVESFDLA